MYINKDNIVKKLAVSRLLICIYFSCKLFKAMQHPGANSIRAGWSYVGVPLRRYVGSLVYNFIAAKNTYAWIHFSTYAEND